MSIKYWYLLLLILPSCLLAQEEEEINPSEPVLSKNYQTYKDELSTLNIPISISLKDIENRINEEYKSVIYNDDSFDDNNNDDIKVKVKKRSKIIVGTLDNRIKVIIPLYIWASKQVRTTVLGQTLAQSGSTDFDITINYYIDLEIKKNWDLETKTTGDFKWDRKPYISVGPVDVPIAGQVEGPLKEQVDEIAKEITKAIKETIDLKAIGKEAWSTVQTPILMDSTTNAWLYINPQSIEVTPLELKYGKAKFDLGITTYVFNTIGEPKRTIVATKLPNLQIVNKIPNDFSIALSATASYENIRSMLKTQFETQTFEFEDQSVTITEMDFKGGADKVVVKVGIDGRLKKGILKKRVKGKLFLEGVPFYDTTDQSIKIRDLEYNIQTKDLLIKSAKWLSDKKIKSMMAENLVFPIGNQVADARKMIEKELTNYKINDYATLRGKLSDLRPEGIYLTPDNIKVIILAKGRLNMSVGGF